MTKRRAPIPSDPATALRMKRQKQKDTNCELVIRQFLHSYGLRYRVDFRPELQIKRKADIVMRMAKVAVFIDGCFWHKCPIHWKAPKRNGSWWTKKVEANAKRDIETTLMLEKAGWCVIRAWEHEDPLEVVYSIMRAVAKRHPNARRLVALQRYREQIERETNSVE